MSEQSRDYVVRVCFERNTLSYAIYEKGTGKRVKEEVIDDVEMIVAKGIVFVKREDLDKARRCMFVESSLASVTKRGKMVILG